MIKNVYQSEADTGKLFAFLIPLYFLFVCTDLYTTWLASPDFKYESNYLIKYFKPGWGEVILFASLWTIILSIMFVVFSKRIVFILSSHKDINIEKNELIKKILPGFLITGIFFSHLFTSVFVTINNLLNYIYLYKKDSLFTNAAIMYVKLQTLFYPYYYIFTQILLIISGFMFAGVRIRKICKRLQQVD